MLPVQGRINHLKTGFKSHRSGVTLFPSPGSGAHTHNLRCCILSEIRAKVAYYKRIVFRTIFDQALLNK